MKSKLFISSGLLVIITLVLSACLDTGQTSPYQKLQEDKAKIDAYLAANPSEDPTDIVVKDDYSGIRMVITEQPVIGEGEALKVPPTPKNVIQVAYTGKLFSNGTIFDSKDSYTFTLSTEDAGGSDVIDGWKYALAMMTQGMKATVYIPSGLGYGPSGKGPIPGNAILVFDLHLKVVNTEDEATQRAKDRGDILFKLGEEDINAVEDPTGIFHIIQSTGTGPKPGAYDKVTIRYTGMLLNGTKFAEGIQQGPVNVFSSRPVNYIHGLTIGLQLMNEGDKATFYIPSVMAYGSSATTNIPANSNLIFEIELLDVAEPE